MAVPNPQPDRRLFFSADMRLHGRIQFARVFAKGRRRSIGPLLVFGAPNGLGRLRLGLSVSRRVGNAVKRHRIKRLIREAVRLDQHELPGSMDIIVKVRPHETLKLDDYRTIISKALHTIQQRWEKAAQADLPDPPPKQGQGS